jgi:hypothetical protein
VADRGQQKHATSSVDFFGRCEDCAIVFILKMHSLESKPLDNGSEIVNCHYIAARVVALKSACNKRCRFVCFRVCSCAVGCVCVRVFICIEVLVGLLRQLWVAVGRQVV